MHLITEETKRYDKALKNKTGGKKKTLKSRVIDKVSDVLAAPKVKYYESKSRQSNKDYDFLKKYNDKKGSGVKISRKDEAIFQSYKNRNKK